MLTKYPGPNSFDLSKERLISAGARLTLTQNREPASGSPPSIVTRLVLIVVVPLP